MQAIQFRKQSVTKIVVKSINKNYDFEQWKNPNQERIFFNQTKNKEKITEINTNGNEDSSRIVVEDKRHRKQRNNDSRVKINTSGNDDNGNRL